MSNVQNKSSPFISLEIRSFEFWSFEIVSSRVGHCADQFGRHSGLPYNPPTQGVKDSRILGFK